MSSEENLFDELIDEFVAEIRDLLDSIEPDFLALEKSGNEADPELINRAFRAIHSIKGAAGFSGFNALNELSHELESVLVKIRDGEMVTDPDKTDAMLAAMDKIRSMADDIHVSNEMSYADELTRLSEIIQKTEARKAESLNDPERIRLNATAEPGEHVFETERDKVASAVSNAMYVFALWLYTDKDLKEKGRTIETFTAALEEAGQCLEADAGDNGICHFLFGTILEPEFLTQMFEIPKKQIYRFERPVILEALAQKDAARQKEKADTPSDVGKETEQETTDLPAGDDPSHGIFSDAGQDTDELTESEQSPDDTDKVPEQNPDYDDTDKVPEQSPDNDDTDKIPEPEQNPDDDDTASPKEKKTESAIFKPKSREDKGDVPSSSQETGERHSTETIRVRVELVDKLMNLVGEMVLGRNQLYRAIQTFIDDNPQINPLVQNLNVVISEVQENIMQMRMQPVANLLNKFPRIVRDLSRQLSKEIDFIAEGGTVELDKSILEGLSNPMTHLVRNCVDHGIETPEDRKKAGKSVRGRISLKVFHDGGQVRITIRDDGKGIDADQVAEKAVSQGISGHRQIRQMSEKEKLNLIFLPGLSTAETVTDISGRGVGMDVVKTSISKLGGHIDMESAVGEGTTVHIIIPLTLAIIPSLIVAAGKFRFAIPQINVQELVCIKVHDSFQKIEKIGNSDVLRLRGRLLPLISLANILDIPCTFIHPETGKELPERRKCLADRQRKSVVSRQLSVAAGDRPRTTDHGPRTTDHERRQNPCGDICIVILRVGMNAFGLHVDELFDNEEIVIKPLSKHIKNCKCFAGATIMGDGRVAMILDASGIASYARLRFGEIEAEERRREKIAEQNRKATDTREPVIIFNNALDEYFALPLAGISRLEIIAPHMIERVGEQDFLMYHGEALPLIHLENILPVSPLPENPKELYIIIPKTRYSKAGILVSRILDTIDTDVSFLSLERAPDADRGFWASTLFDGHLTFFLNTEEILESYEKNLDG